MMPRFEIWWSVAITVVVIWLAIAVSFHTSEHDAETMRLLNENIRLRDLILNQPFCIIERDA